MRRTGTRLALSGLLLLSACTRYEPFAVNGAASMRVEVEVYKGPLSVSPAAQMGELVAVMSDAVRASHEWRLGAGDLRAARQCDAQTTAAGDPYAKADCDALQSAIDSAEDVIGAACYVLDTPVMRETVAWSSYLPYNTCGQYYDAWRHIEKGRVDLGTIRAPKGETIAALLQKTDAEADIIVELRRSLAQAPPAKRAEIEATLAKAIAERTANLVASFNTIAAGLQGQALTASYVKALGCGAGLDRDDDAARQKDAAGEPERSAATAQPPRRGTTNLMRCLQEPVVMAVQNVATVMRAAGYRITHGRLRYVPADKVVRSQLVAFGFLAAEYGNQLQARISVLGKQLADGKDGSNLPVGDYLRDAAPTDAVHLFEWLDAGNPRTAAGGLDLAARTRLIERLTADYYWEKVNEVYASGQGDVAMAFIKDDLGNWNLKSFSNDPTELLRSYRKATDAMISTAAKLAAKAGTGGGSAVALSGAQRALALANQFATGKVAGDNGMQAQVDRLGTQLYARLNLLKVSFKDREKPLDEAVVAAESALKKAREAAAADAGKQAEVTKAEADLAEAKKRRGALALEAANLAELILQDHQQTIGALQQSVVAQVKPQ